MPARKKVEPNRDIDALLKQANFTEPEPVAIKWRGRVWTLTPITAIDPRKIGSMDTVEGVVSLIEEALGEKQAEEFPMPRGVELPDGRTEMSVFLDAWTSASDEELTSPE